MDINWNDIFSLSVSPIEPILRGTIMYFAIFVLFRVVIRRRVGAIGMSDLLLVVIIADAAESGLSGDDHTITHGLIVVGTIFLWNWLIDWLNYRVPALRILLEPSPLPLIEKGRILRQNLRQEYVTIDELKSKLREHGVADPAEVEKAVMEPDGEVSVIRRKPPPAG
ncbi:MAG: DUF421 domain-containing protein [Pseudomonadota bacterium]|nr:DUF421 domain-containing protein [Pseudomonadota bacterium]